MPARLNGRGELPRRISLTRPTRRHWLFTTSTLGLACCLALAKPALAADECGPISGGSVTCTPAGNNYTSGIAYSSDDDLTMVVQDGVIVTTTGDLVEGIQVLLPTTASVLNLTIGAATITTEGQNAEAIVAQAESITATISAAIVTQGLGADAVELHAEQNSVTFSGDIETHGFGATGLVFYSGLISVDLTTTADSTIRTYGDDSLGIVVGAMYYNSGANHVNITHSGSIVTGLDYVGSANTSNAYGILIEDADYGDVNVTVTGSGSITTYGGEAHGILIRGTGSSSENHDVTVTIHGSVTANGIGANALRVRDTYGNVNITIGGTVMGGAGGEGAISLDNPHATSSTITITDTGEIGSLDDLAIIASEAVTISNAGTITGFIILGDGDDSFTNSGTWYLRNYVDTDGDERIDLEAAGSLNGEVAARLGLPLGAGEIYVDGGLRHEFLGETEAEVSGLRFADQLPGTLGFLAGGLAFSLLQDKLSLALDAGYAKGDAAEEVTANAALRVVY